jgi:1-aminocyclopropane-1-carboxylate deaminase/D-cysteine desulfhydrase-like pyridoxal-dependent ACC family enzyme
MTAAPPRHRSLTPTPTPLDPAPRFSASVGRKIFVKRDDIGSVGLAGNKVRKLEYIAAQADQEHIVAFVLVGALQSNAARALAAFCAATGRRCVLVVPDVEHELASPEGNLLLSLLFGAEIRFAGVTDWSQAEDVAREIAAEIEASGQRVLVLPAGASTPLGAASFVAAYQELMAQVEGLDPRPTLVVHASASGGTAAGLHLGRLAYAGPQVLSIDVGRLYPDVTSRIAELATGVADLLKLPHAVTSDDVSISFDFVGDGYGIASPECLEAIRLLARTEGIICDPVYSGKALAAICRGDLPGGSEPVVFWHTGGAQSVLTQTNGRLLLGDRERSAS